MGHSHQEREEAGQALRGGVLEVDKGGKRNRLDSILSLRRDETSGTTWVRC